MTDEITCIVFSPDQRLLAVSLLDTTVKVFFADSLKFFLSLFGHKLPVLSMDISQDSTLLATGCVSGKGGRGGNGAALRRCVAGCPAPAFFAASIPP